MFWSRNKKIIFSYALLSGGLSLYAGSFFVLLLSFADVFPKQIKISFYFQEH